MIFWHHPAQMKRCQYEDSTPTLWFMSSSLVIFYISDKIKMLNRDVVNHAGPPRGFLIELGVCVPPVGTSLKYFQHLMGARVICCFQRGNMTNSVVSLSIFLTAKVAACLLTILLLTSRVSVDLHFLAEVGVSS